MHQEALTRLEPVCFDTLHSAAPTYQQPVILCVDDDPNILKTLKRQFWEQPLTVLTATSGREALAILQSAVPISLIISDQKMPGMSGSEFLAAAREIAPDIPRMILTGYADSVEIAEAMTTGGACRILTKTWVEKELLQTVLEFVMPAHRLM